MVEEKRSQIPINHAQENAVLKLSWDFSAVAVWCGSCTVLAKVVQYNRPRLGFFMKIFKIICLTVWCRKAVKFDKDVTAEDSLESGSEHEGAGSPEGSVDVEGVVVVKVEQLDGAVLLQGALHVPQLAIYQSQS